MTCVVGFIENDTTFMGADSAGVSDCYLQTRADSKVFINGEFIFGFTSSFRMGQLLRYKFTPPSRKEGQDIFNYMVTDFVEGVRECLKTGGYTRISDNEETGGTFLVGYRNRLFCIDNDFQVAELIGQYASVGCGRDIALGSLYSTNGQQAEFRIKTALEAAQEYNSAVRGPFSILKITHCRCD